MKKRVTYAGCAVVGLCWLSGVAAEAPKRPADYRPYRYEVTSEQLSEKYSVNQMRRAEKELQEMAEVNRKGPWQPTWESIDQHRAPEWFLDAKLGIMINWGLYSVPAWDQKRDGAMYPDAYASSMYSDPTLMAHHAQYWGKDFQYDDFFALFSATNYDPEAWMQLLEEVGVRYVVPFCKHHDGVAWWDSAWSKRSFVQMGPKRDLFTPLQSAARKHGLKVIMYFCYEEYATAVLGPDNRPNCRTWNGAYARLNAMTDENRRRVQGHIPVTNYYDHYMTPLVKEMIDRFEPDGLWMDGEWATPTETLRSRELAAYFYNKIGSSKEVYVNDRYGTGTRHHHGDVFGSEFHSTSSLVHAWEECRGISHSFAYNYEDDDSVADVGRGPGAYVHRRDQPQWEPESHHRAGFHGADTGIAGGPA